MAVAVRVLKNQLSAYLRRVRAGEHVVVTDRGRPVAELSPIGVRRLTPQERVQRMVQAGEVVPAQGAGLAKFEPIKVRGRSIAKTLLEDRD